MDVQLHASGVGSIRLGRYRSRPVATQESIHRAALAAGVDPELSWSERELPEHRRTKHVHRLHPYLGKYVPQLVEAFLLRHFTPGQRVLDPFAGSGTTLVECSTYGCPSVGVDVSAFNVLLASAKTRVRDADVVDADLRRRAGALRGRRGHGGRAGRPVPRWSGTRRAPSTSSCASAASSTTIPRAPTCCASCSAAPPARPG